MRALARSDRKAHRLIRVSSWKFTTHDVEFISGPASLEETPELQSDRFIEDHRCPKPGTGKKTGFRAPEKLNVPTIVGQFVSSKVCGISALKDRPHC